MARLEWSNSYNNSCNWRGKWGSYKRTTLLFCLIKIVVALYVLHPLCTLLYMYPYSDSINAFRYTADQIRKMEESIRIQKESEPTKLTTFVQKLKKEILKEERVEVPQPLKQKITDDLLFDIKSRQC